MIFVINLFIKFMKNKIIIIVICILLAISIGWVWQSQKDEKKSLVNEPIPQNTVSDLNKIQDEKNTFIVDLHDKGLKDITSRSISFNKYKNT